MARWGGLAQCDKCPHRQARDHRLPLGQPPNPLCPDGWVEGPGPIHTIPGPQYRPSSEMGKYTGLSRKERNRTAQYSLKHFCLACACWEGVHTPVTNNSRTWLCRRHLRVFQAWKRKHGLPPISRTLTSEKFEAQREAKRQTVLATLSSGPQSLREVATALDCSVESTRYHLNRLAARRQVERIKQRHGQSWIAWQLIEEELCKANAVVTK